MRITLAYPWTDPDTGEVHAPDSTVDLPRHVAKRLMQGGKARPAAPEQPPLPRVDVRRQQAADVHAQLRAERGTTSLDTRPGVDPAQATTPDSPEPGATDEGAES